MLDWFNSLDQLSSDKATLTPWRPASKKFEMHQIHRKLQAASPF